MAGIGETIAKHVAKQPPKGIGETIARKHAAEKVKKQLERGTYRPPLKEKIKEVAIIIKQRQPVKEEPLPPEKKTFTKQEYRQHIYGEYEKAGGYISEAEAYKASLRPGGKIWESIEPGMQYKYTDPVSGKTSVLTSAGLKQRLYDESRRIRTGPAATAEMSIHASKLWKHYQETGEYPAGTKFVKTATGYQVEVPDTRLEWAKGERQKIEKLPPGIKELAMFGYTAVSSLAALGKPIAPFILEQPERLGIFFGPYGWVMGKVMRETGFVPSGIKPSEMKPVHYVSGLDIAFEHFGSAPKGAVEELRKTGPAGWAGAAAGEFLQLAGFHYALKPVGVGVKYVGGKVITHPSIVKGVTKISTGLGKGFGYTTQKISPYAPKVVGATYGKLFAPAVMKTTPMVGTYGLRLGIKPGIISKFMYQSPKVAGIMLKKAPAYLMKETPRATTKYGMLFERMGEKLGIYQFTQYGTKQMYRRVLFPHSVTWKDWSRKVLIGGKEITHKIKTDFGTFATGKFQYPGRKLFTISGMYPKLVPHPTMYSTISKEYFKGISKQAMLFGIEPTKGKLTFITAKTTIGKPYGLFARKLPITQKAIGMDIQQLIHKGWKIPEYTAKEFWSLPYFPAVGKGKVITLGKAAAKPSLTGTFTTGGAMPRLTLTRGEQQLLRFAEATGQPYKSVSKLMPSALKTRFPKMIFISPQATAYSSNLLAGLLGGGIIAIPHLTQVGISKLEREMRQPTTFKPTTKRVTVKTLTFERAITGADGTAIVNDLKQSLIDASALMDFSITGITPAQAQAQAQKQAQLRAFMFGQVSLQKAKQVAVTRALPQLTIPALWFPTPRLYGRGGRHPDRDLWGLESHYREAVIPSLSEVDRRIMKTMGIGLRPTKSRKKIKKRRR